MGICVQDTVVWWLHEICGNDESHSGYIEGADEESHSGYIEGAVLEMKPVLNTAHMAKNWD